MRRIRQQKPVFLGNGKPFDYQESLRLTLQLIYWMLCEAKGFSIVDIEPETSYSYLRIAILKRSWRFALLPFSSSKNNVTLQCPNTHETRIRSYNDLNRPCQHCVDQRYTSIWLQRYILDTDFIRNPPE